MKPYRRHLIGLPLQRSCFAHIDRAPALIGLTDHVLGARLSDGDLFLDHASIERVSAALTNRLTPEFLDQMEQSILSACDALERATDTSCARAAAADEEEAGHLIRALGDRATTMVSFGIMSKFVPDVLYRAFVAHSPVEIPQLTSESPGATLTRDSFALFSECRADGFDPHRLRMAWPDVPPAISERVLAFCRRQTGFGPLRWEATGFENPHYVLATLQSCFEDQSAGVPCDRLEGMARRTRDASDALPSPARGSLARVIVVWRELLERETWYLRRAFYVGVLPLLHRLVPVYLRRDRQMVKEDILFFEIDELTTLRPDARRARERRMEYLSNRDYLGQNGISTDRLGAILEAV